MITLRFYFVTEVGAEDVLHFALDQFNYEGDRVFIYNEDEVFLNMDMARMGIDASNLDHEVILEELGFLPSLSLWIEMPDDMLETVLEYFVPIVITFLEQSDENAVLKADAEPLLVRLNGRLVLNSTLWKEENLRLVTLPYELIADIDIWLIENMEE